MEIIALRDRPGPVCTVHRAAAHCLPAGVLMDVWELLRKA